MARVSKRPAEHIVLVSDTNRVPVPTIPRDAHLPRYTITPLGHVYRDDGRLLTPYYNGTQLKVSLCADRFRRSLPKLVFLAFGHPDLLARWHAGDLRTYDPWFNPMNPIDPATTRPVCTVHDVVLVPHKDLIAAGIRGHINPKRLRTRLPILSPPP